MIAIPPTAAALLAALDAAPSAPEPPAETTDGEFTHDEWIRVWDFDPNAQPAEPYAPPPTYTADEVAAIASRTAHQAVQADRAEAARARESAALHPPIAVTPFVGKLIVTYRRETSEAWAVFVALAVLCATLSSVVGVVASLVLALVAWVKR